jgi:hypothetical protein
MLIHIKRNAEVFGPYSVEEAREYLSSGRLVLSDFAQLPGTTEWIPLALVPGIKSAPPPPPPGPAEPPRLAPTAIQPAAHQASSLSDSAGQPAAQQKRVAITSFVLGLLSLLLCVIGALPGIPAIICGHLARARARRLPGQYGGAGFALAGLIMGYVGVLVSVLITPAFFLPALARAKYKAQSINCSNNMKQIGLAFRSWAIDNDGNFPFNLSTNKGGTLEWCMPGSDGFDQNAALHFQVLSNELSAPKLLVCPTDSTKRPALNFLSLLPENVSYQLRSGANIVETNPEEVLAVCPIHNRVLMCDGWVLQSRKGPRE